MTTCACCGQNAGARSDDDTQNCIEVEEVLLSCCRSARVIARRQGAPTIEIAHLALAASEHPAASRTLRVVGIDPDELGRIAAQHKSDGLAIGTADDSDEGQPAMSAELLTLLDRAERFARSKSRDTITLNMVIATLLNDANDLESARFIQSLHPGVVASQSEHRGSQLDGDDQHDDSNDSDPFQLRLNPTFDQDGSEDGRDAMRAYGSGKAIVTSKSSATVSNRTGQRPRRDRDTSDPFQLRINTDYEDEQDSENARTSFHKGHGAPQPAGVVTRDRDSTSILRDVDRRLDEMQLMLGKIESATQSMNSAQLQSLRQSGSENMYRAIHDDRTGEIGSERPLRRAWRISRNRLRARVADAHSTRARHDRYSDHETWSGEAQYANHLDHLDHLGSEAEMPDPHGYDDDMSSAEIDPREKRFYLEPNDGIVNAPSIGQLTADRLTPHGIARVKDLFTADPVELAERVNARHITPARIEDWQMQARLVCTIPWLRGTHAQMLVGAGYTTPGDINAADVDQLCADILKFAATRDGQRILRTGPPPKIEKIIQWTGYASQAELNRAA